jgi:uncharacterized membrane protein
LSVEERDLKKLLNVKALIIGGTFLLVMSGLGSWWFGLPLWETLLIGLACMVLLGVAAAFENGVQRRNGSE